MEDAGDALRARRARSRLVGAIDFDASVDATSRRRQGAIVRSNAKLDGPSEWVLLGLPNATYNGFDVVSIRIQSEGSVVGGSRTRTRTGLAIVCSTSINCGAMELLDLLLAVSFECKVNPGSPVGSAKVECRRTALLEANVDVGAPP